MAVQRRDLLLGTLATGLLRGRSAEAQSPAAPALLNDVLPGLESIDLWPDQPPGLPRQAPQESLIERSAQPEIRDRAITGVVRPRLLVIRPENPNGAAMMIIPGGAYQRVVIDKEGLEPGLWFAARGITVFALIYRLPGDGWVAAPDVALADAQRGMRLIRSHAAEFGFDPKHVASMGFSAGGHICARLATGFSENFYPPVDTADTYSARPFVAAPIYPVISMTGPAAHTGSRDTLIGQDADEELQRTLSPQLHVPDDAPPCFLVHAEDDNGVDIRNTLDFRAALRARGISVETHLFAHGGHGFGVREAQGKPVAAWPELLYSWSQSMGLIPACNKQPDLAGC